MSQALSAPEEEGGTGPDPEDTVNEALAKRMAARKMLTNASYFAFHGAMSHGSMAHSSERRNPTWQQTAVATSHCGAGCTLGDIIAEFSLFALGATLLGSLLYASFAADLFLAWLLGIAFQYFTIKPMRNLTPAQALIAALKADTLSILAFEVGLFGWMALTYFVFFPDPHLNPTQPLYWFMMQIGIVIGYFTSYPMNSLLVRWGLKEAM
jgi:hypothetical protein